MSLSIRVHSFIIRAWTFTSTGDDDQTTVNNKVFDMSSTDDQHYDAHSPEGEVFGWADIMYKRFWVDQTPPVETWSNNEGFPIKYIPANYLEGNRKRGRATLVRPEYEECWARLQSDIARGSTKGLLIWGSSGSGPSGGNDLHKADVCREERCFALSSAALFAQQNGRRNVLYRGVSHPFR